MRYIAKIGGKKYLVVMASIIMVLILAACSAAPVNSTAVAPVISTTANSSQTVIQTTPTPSPSPSITPTTTTPPMSSSSTPEPATPNAEPPPPTSPIYTPTAKSYIPTGTEAYVLELINKDRQDAGFNPVVLSYNAAAQEHAQDMLDNNYQAAHWGTDGLKPYMRYTVAGGLNYEQENSAYLSTNDPQLNSIELKLAHLQSSMMAEIAPNDGHKVNMLNKWHKKVSLGIAYNTETVALVQQFEGEYVEYSKPPTLEGNILSLTGHFTQNDIKLENIIITYDTPPQPLTTAQLNQDIYHHYGLGQQVGAILQPPPPGSYYPNLSPREIVPTTGSFNYHGWFDIQEDISKILIKGPGVYTVVLVATVGNTNERVNMTNYSLFYKLFVN